MGQNHQLWSRHLGRIVRDRTICPIQVKAWKEIGENEKNHMWEAVKVNYPFYYLLVKFILMGVIFTSS